MNNPAIKLNGWLLIAACLLISHVSLQAQTGTVNFGTSSNVVGTYSADFGLSNQVIGNYTAAFGHNSSATGQGSFAVGENCDAGGQDSFVAGSGNLCNDNGVGEAAFGINTYAQQSGAFTCGQNTQANWYSFAAGYYTTASGSYAATFGYSTTASSASSVAFGTSTAATANSAAAFNYATTASGASSAAFGNGSQSSGVFSASFGELTNAKARSCVVIGAENVGLNADGVTAADPNNWVVTDPLFEIGNGGNGGWCGTPGINHTSDALVVYKNGNMTVNGANNKMPNQTLTGTSSVLTEGLGDARYISKGANASTALGSSTASSTAATAMGSSTASSFYTTAMGSSTASGSAATAMGSSTASGQNSTAMGFSTASGNYSTAAGQYTTGVALDSFVVGAVNVGLNANGITAANSGTWVATDPIFEIGNGGASLYGGLYHYGDPNKTTPSDALVVYKNGNAVVQGSVTAPTVIVTTPSPDIPVYNGS